MEHCIIYFSTLREPFHEQDLVETLERSRQKNAVNGISSVTLYVRGNIIQVLEGQKEAVETLYARIEQDDQHSHVIKILSRPIHQRLFAGSTLAYETITLRQLEELRTVVSLEDDKESSFASETPFVLKLIKTFYESNRHN